MSSILKIARSCLRQAFDFGSLGTVELATLARRDVHYAGGPPRRVYPPRRPPTAYILFYKEMFPQVYAENKEGKVSEIAKKIGTIWKSISASQRKPFEEKSNDLWEEYRDNLGIFQARASEDDLERVKTEKAMKRKRKLLLEMRKDRKDSVPPRPSAFGLFVSQQSRLVSQPFKGVHLFKHLGQEWRKMTEEEKKPFFDEAESKLKTYHEKLNSWKSTRGSKYF